MNDTTAAAAEEYAELALKALDYSNIYTKSESADKWVKDAAKTIFLAGAAYGRKQALEWVLKLAHTSIQEGDLWTFPSNDDICKAIEQQLAGGEHE